MMNQTHDHFLNNNSSIYFNASPSPSAANQTINFQDIKYEYVDEHMALPMTHMNSTGTSAFLSPRQSFLNQASNMHISDPLIKQGNKITKSYLPGIYNK